MGKRTKKIEPSVNTTTYVIEKSPSIKWWHKIVPPVLLSGITAAFYYPSLKYPFQFDDLANITKKFNIRFYDALSNWWTNRRWMGEWLNRMNFELGRFEPYYYRLTNLVVHILTGLFVFFLILEGCSRLKKNSFLSRHALAISTATSALFLLHPVQTQAVSYVIQARLEGLATLFVVATLFFILKGFQSQNPFVRYFLLFVSLFLGFISCGTKEIAIVSPFLAILLDWFLISEQSWDSFKSRIWFHAIFSTVIFITFIHYLTPYFISNIVTLQTSTTNNRGNVLTGSATDLIQPFQFLFSNFKVVLHYLYIFIWPFGLSVEYDWKLSESIFSPDSFFPLIALLTILFFAVLSFVKNKFAFFGFGIIWFLISIAPRSSIIPSPELICDYKTYLSSIGWLFVISTSFVAFISFIVDKIKLVSLNKTQLQLATILVLALPIGCGSMVRNTVWSSSVAFWQDIVDKAPLKARGHNNLGVAMSEEQGKYKEAIPYYLEAIRLDRFYSDPWSNLAVAYSAVGDIDRAIASSQQAIKILPYYPEAYNNLGTLLIKKKDYDLAEKSLKRALVLRPYYGKAFYNLGRLYLDQNKPELAWEHFKKATEGDLDTKEGFYTLGQMSLKLKKYDAAADAFEKTLQFGQGTLSQDSEMNILFSLANSYFMLKKYDKAERVFEVLCSKNPNDHRYWYNLGETYYSDNKFDKAHTIFKRLVEPPFNMAQANIRLANALEKLDKLDEAKNVFEKFAKIDGIPADMKDLAKKEVGRLTIQKKINSGNCTLTMKDLKKVFGKA